MIELLLLGNDLEYGYMLGRSISNLHRNFNVSIKSLESYLKSCNDKEYDLILASGYRWDMLNQYQISYKNLIILSDDPVASLDHQLNKRDNHSHPLMMYKYLRVSEMVSGLSYLYGLNTGKENLIQNAVNTKIISFYSACGGAGTSCISLSTARELSRYRDKKVLFLCFDEISALVLYMNDRNREHSLGDFLYYLFQKKDAKVCSLFESFLFQDEYGVYSFPSRQEVNELYCLKKEELIHFFKVILSKNMYDYIILDLNSDIRMETFFLLNFSKHTVIVETPCIVSTYKNSAFFKYATRMKQDGFAKEVTMVKNMVAENHYDHIEEEGYQGERQAVIQIEKDKDSFEIREDGLDISINNVFGLGIKNIADKIQTF